MTTALHCMSNRISSLFYFLIFKGRRRTKAPNCKRSVKLFAMSIVLISIFESLALARADPLVIRGSIFSTHDRLPPIEVLGIVKQAEFKITLSADNRIEESWTYLSHRTDVSNVRIGKQSQDEQTKLGKEGENVLWHVKGHHSLTRISQGKNYVLTMTFEIDDGKHCRLTAKYVLQAGKTFVILRRADNGEDANFTFDKVKSAICSVD